MTTTILRLLGCLIGATILAVCERVWPHDDDVQRAAAGGEVTCD